MNREREIKIKKKIKKKTKYNPRRANRQTGHRIRSNFLSKKSKKPGKNQNNASMKVNSYST